MLKRLQGLAVRDRQPELMDDPCLDEKLHQAALRGLKRVNFFSRTSTMLWRAIESAFPPESKPPTTLRILDVACGGGDITIDLAKRAQRAGRSVAMVGCDISETAIRYATENAVDANVDAQFEICDAISQLPVGYDAIVCSLFLHHLDDERIVDLLRSMRQSGARLIAASDLVRSRSGYLLCRIGTQLLTRSHIVHVDGPLSVRAALTIDEAAACARKAGLESAEITTHWPERYLLTWRRPEEPE